MGIELLLEIHETRSVVANMSVKRRKTIPDFIELRAKCTVGGGVDRLGFFWIRFGLSKCRNLKLGIRQQDYFIEDRLT